MSATWAKRYHSLKRSQRFGNICEKLRCRKTYCIFIRVLKIPTHVVKIVLRAKLYLQKMDTSQLTLES